MDGTSAHSDNLQKKNAKASNPLAFFWPEETEPVRKVSQ